MNIKVVINSVFWIFIFIYLWTLNAKVTGALSNGFFRNYLNDLLCIPIVLYLTTWLLRIIYRNVLIQLDTAKIVVAVITFSICFEWIAPNYHTVHTGDWIDVLCYSFGGVVFKILSPRF
jgi:hypothetical protein